MGLLDLIKRKKKAFLSEEDLKWNKMWELWTEDKVESPYAELMKYQSEIYNGGHSQYFTNVENVSDLSKAMSALEPILSSELKDNLQKAYQAYRASEEKDEGEAAEATLEQCDDMFYEREDEINSILKGYAAKLEL